MGQEISGLIPTLIGGGLALGGSFGATWLSKHLEVKHQSKQLALAIKGELQAIAHIVTLRQYAIGFRLRVKEMQERGIPLLSFITIEQDYTQIYKANGAKIGSLKKTLPTDVAIVYTQISSLLDDISYLNACCLKQTENDVYRPGISDLIPRLSAIADLLDDTVQRASKVCENIDLIYPD